MHFLANENFPYPSIKLLREAGYDIKSISEEFSGITDPQVIEIALDENRIILTFDKDYGELIFRLALQNPPAIVFFRHKGASPEFAAELLLKLVQENQIVLENTFTVVEQNNIRQRKY